MMPCQSRKKSSSVLSKDMELEPTNWHLYHMKQVCDRDDRIADIDAEWAKINEVEDEIKTTYQHISAISPWWKSEAF
jgi:hypothetical protein